MPPRDQIFEAAKEWFTASNPGLVTRDQLAQVEERLEELAELVDELESRVAARVGTQKNEEA